MTEPVPIPAFDLAAALANPPADGLIQVPSGIWPIKCDGVVNKCVANGITIRGQGYQRSRIINSNPANDANNQPCLWFTGADCTVEDLLLDAGSDDGEQYARSCLRMDGANPAARRVIGINPSGNKAAGRECFTFFVSGGGGSGIIDQCRVEQAKGNYVEGFNVSGSVKVRDCHVEYSVLETAEESTWFGGYQAAYSNGASFVGCSQNGGQAFFYTDTGSDSNLLIADGFATNVMRGIIMVRQTGFQIDGLNIHDTIIELSPNADWTEGSNAIAITGPGAKRNCRFNNNLLRFVGGATVAAGRICSIGVFDGEVSGTVMMGNSWDSSMLQPQAPSDTQAAIHANPNAARAVLPNPT